MVLASQRIPFLLICVNNTSSCSRYKSLMMANLAVKLIYVFLYAASLRSLGTIKIDMRISLQFDAFLQKMFLSLYEDIRQYGDEH